MFLHTAETLANPRSCGTTCVRGFFATRLASSKDGWMHNSMTSSNPRTYALDHGMRSPAAHEHTDRRRDVMRAASRFLATAPSPASSRCQPRWPRQPGRWPRFVAEARRELLSTAMETRWECPPRWRSAASAMHNSACALVQPSPELR